MKNETMLQSVNITLDEFIEFKELKEKYEKTVNATIDRINKQREVRISDELINVNKGDTVYVNLYIKNSYKLVKAKVIKNITYGKNMILKRRGKVLHESYGYIYKM